MIKYTYLYNDEYKKKYLKYLSKINLIKGGNNENYDYIFHIKSLLDITDGWKITVNNECDIDNFFRDREQYNVVSVFGHYNIGKTFIISKLSGIQFDHSTTTHTEGLSIKVTKSPNVVYIDSEGTNTPIEINETPESANRKTLDDVINDGKKKENFIKEFLFMS
jgi:hypothetical protein